MIITIATTAMITKMVALITHAREPPHPIGGLAPALRVGDAAQALIQHVVTESLLANNLDQRLLPRRHPDHLGQEELREQGPAHGESVLGGLPVDGALLIVQGHEKQLLMEVELRRLHAIRVSQCLVE